MGWVEGSVVRRFDFSALKIGRPGVPETGRKRQRDERRAQANDPNTAPAIENMEDLMRLLAEIDGEAVPLEDCDWVLWAPCGCAVGVLVARHAADEDAAMREFVPTKRERARKRRDGYWMELVTHQRWREEISESMRAVCPHRAEDVRSDPPTKEPGHV